MLLYSPAVAVPLAVNTQVSPASSRPSWFVSPPTSDGEDRRRVDARDVVADVDAGQRHVARGRYIVGPGHRAADGNVQAGGVVVVGAVGQLDDVDVGRVAVVVVRVARRLLGNTGIGLPFASLGVPTAVPICCTGRQWACRWR